MPDLDPSCCYNRLGIFKSCLICSSCLTYTKIFYFILLNSFWVICVS